MGQTPRRLLRRIVTARALLARGVRYPPMAKASDSTSAHGYGQPRDWDGDGRVQRKDDDVFTPSAAHMSRRPRGGLIQRPSVRLAQTAAFA